VSFRSTSDQVWLEDQAWLESRYPDLAKLHAAGTNMTAIDAMISQRELPRVTTNVRKLDPSIWGDLAA
jgi:hypothetical protein